MVIRAMKKIRSELENRNKSYSFKLGGQREYNLTENVRNRGKEQYSYLEKVHSK